MMQQKRLFQSLFILLIVVAAALGYLQYNDRQSTNDRFDLLSETFSNSTKALNTSIAAQQGELEILEQRNLLLEAQLKSAIGALESSISDAQTATQKQLEGLAGKILTVEQETQEGFENLEDRIVSLDISSSDFTAIVEDVLDSIISISTDKGEGSGVIVSTEGYAVTNYHVLEGISSGGVRTYDQNLYSFRIVATNTVSDLALIQLITSDPNFEKLRFENDARVGERVIALGSPAGFDFTVTEGIVSAINRRNADGVTYVQTDVPINPGNSGGPLVNTNGRIIGINTFKTKDMEGIGFAIEARIVDNFVDDAIAADQTT